MIDRTEFAIFEEFWAGTGPSPLIFAAPHLAKGKTYFQHTLVEQHASSETLLKEALLEAERNRNLLGDGIPTIRADLGTTLLPSGLGLSIDLLPNQHPWMIDHLSAEEYADRGLEIWEQSGEIPLATAFYQQLRTTEGVLPHPYLPDTQGIFDLSHLIVGNDLFLILVDDPDLVHSVQLKSIELYLRATRYFKQLIGEKSQSMLHGHGMPGGVWFPDTGTRISEDSATLISEVMINEFVLPYMKKAVAPFGRGFLHFCGRHEGFLAAATALEEISTINLGNPESYDLDELFRICGETDTVYFGHLPVKEGDDAVAHLERTATRARKSRTRVILILPDIPADDQTRGSLQRRWQELTRG